MVQFQYNVVDYVIFGEWQYDVLDNFLSSVVDIVSGFFYYYWCLFEDVVYNCCNVGDDYDGEDDVCCQNVDIKCWVGEQCVDKWNVGKNIVDWFLEVCCKQWCEDKQFLYVVYDIGDCCQQFNSDVEWMFQLVWCQFG